jgi:hypothetical protein
VNDQSTAIQDQSEMGVIFVHSELDDRNLSVAEFRVYCHIARRAGKQTAFAGIDSMAKVCCIAKHTVISAIRILESYRMILVTRKAGTTTHYTLTPKSKWTPLPNLHTQEGSANGVTHRCKAGNATGANGVTKGNPSKVIPLRKSQPSLDFELPPELETPEFRAAWQDWEQHRREIKHALTDSTRQKQIKRLAKEGLKVALRTIENSIEKGYHGLYDSNSRNDSEATNTNLENVRIGRLADAARAAGDEAEAVRLERQLKNL